MTQKILITGAAGFIGFHVARFYAARGHDVIGIDNLNDYYDPKLKQDRLLLLSAYKNFSFFKIDIADADAVLDVFKTHKPDIVIHLAAQAGVRYSLDHPHAYINSNITGFLNILEACRAYPVRHLVYASSSSVYGGNQKLPFAVSDPVDQPVSLYAATKKSNELMAYSYAHLFKIPMTGLRFFTVYGDYGRPDMAYFKFVKAILAGAPIDVYNHGEMSRDFTFIDDIVDGIDRVVTHVPQNNPPYHLFNIGHNKPENLMTMICLLETLCERKAVINFMPMQAGDVVSTYADIEDLKRATGFEPKTELMVGLQSFVKWYRNYYKI
jgi:UDP-glucuronate 4-epimerase